MSNIRNDDYLYKLVFKALSNISKSGKSKEEKVKIIRIITKLIENILTAEKNNEDSEKFRKIRVKNPNISLMFEIDGNYEFIKAIGFEEKTIDDNIFLYLPKSSVNIPLLEKLLSHIELLILNFQGEDKDEENYYEKNSLKKSVYTEDYFNKANDDNELNNNDNNNNNDNEDNDDSFNMEDGDDFFDNLKESSETKIVKKNKININLKAPPNFPKEAEQAGNPIKSNDNNIQPNNIFGDPSKKKKKVRYKLKVDPNKGLLNNPNNRIAIDCNQLSSDNKKKNKI